MTDSGTGLLIAQLRKERGLTQKQLADQLHISDRTVSKWERSAGFPDVSLLEPLADALGCSVVSILQGRIVEETTEPDVRSAVKILARESRRALLRNWGQRIAIACLLLMVGFMLFGILERAGVFSRAVEQTFTAGIYSDGKQVGETTVTISGERSILGKHRYWGRFAIAAAEDTCREDTSAVIRWDDKTDYASIWYYSDLSFVSESNAEVSYFFYCSHKMDWFALTLSDGRIIATSEGVAQLQSLRPYEYPIRAE